MKKDTLLKIEVFSSGDDDKHRIISAKEIEHILRNIAEKGSRVALYFGNENEFILTTLLKADHKGMWLEQSSDPLLNNRAAQSEKLVFVSSLHKVKIQFTTAQISVVEYQGKPAFYIPQPDNLFRLQRREYYRLMTPASQLLNCVIPPARPLAQQPRQVTVMDISGGGIGLTCTEHDTDLVPGQSYADCRIDLPEIGSIRGTIEVKNVVVLTTATGQTHKRAGCEFKNLDPSAAIMLQRYITHLQRAKLPVE